MPHPSVLEIDLAAIDHNMRQIRRIVGPDCGICPILKADAYGLGAERIAPRLARAGAELFAVYSSGQAAQLLSRGVTVPVLVLMPLRHIGRADELYRGLVSGKLHLTVHDLDHLDDIVHLTERYGARAHLHLEVDTGMSRGGCSLDEAPAMLARIRDEPRLGLAGVFTHFACAERDIDETDRQLEAFEALLEESADLIPDDCLIHAANSYAVCRHPRFHKRMVRVGLAWAGYAGELMSGQPIVAEAETLQPAITWSTKIVHTRRIPAGQPVGYGYAWTARRDSRLAVVPVGYADGYPYGLGGTDDRYEPARVLVIATTDEGEVRCHAPVVGAISMDQMTIDLTEIDQRQPEVGRHIGVGTVVQLITPDREAPDHLTRLAQGAGLLPHGVLCGLHPRVRRVYIEPETPVIEAKPLSPARRPAVR